MLRSSVGHAGVAPSYSFMDGTFVPGEHSRTSFEGSRSPVMHATVYYIHSNGETRSVHGTGKVVPPTVERLHLTSTMHTYRTTVARVTN